ncbi:MAG: penicillin-binding transpeptidase domain-containing protein, partial [Eubacterium sp.]
MGSRIKKQKKRKPNKELMVVTYMFSIIFFAMFGYFVYFMVYESGTVVNNTYNDRVEIMAKTVTRGSIYSADNELLAYTDTDNEGNEIRVYPYDSLFSHIIGLNQYSKGGLELAYDYELLTSSTSIVEQIGNDFTDTKDIGNNIVTTLDTKIQQISYDSLGDYDGAIIVMEPDTGKILAMVSKPDYNPNKIADIWDELTGEDSTSSALVNRATQGLYTPGSIFKIFTTLEYMRENDNIDDFSYTCYGSTDVAGYTVNCYDSTPHYKETIVDAFANSCNSAYVNVGLTLDCTKFSKLCKDMLFNSNLPINIQYNKSSFNLDTDSTPFDISQASIGQGTTLVTPLHMALIVSSIANNGVMMQPYLVSRVENYEGIVQKRYNSEEYKRIMTKSEAVKLQECMEAVVDYGTATILNTDKYECAGKTGTAEIDSKNNVNSWF